ncbi:MAG: 3-deoxy-manno-octulosonate cytidylyltransferase [Roseibacillus sp.]|nr:3-deoxy-manno-octulosonate cytidylyltransferase [Roseibacillus sp.]
MPAEGTTAKVAGIIPARWGSSRFPGKPLHLLAGKSLLQHVYERVNKCQQVDLLLVATDDIRIKEEASSFGAEVVMTSPEHPTGTDRIAEAVGPHPEITHVINIQGDEPLVNPALVDSLAAILKNEPGLSMITAANPMAELDQLDDPDIVKVVVDGAGNALYFSRSPLPYLRTHPDALTPLRHMGLYGYRRDFLEQFVSWPPGLLEQAEQLEQLRALEHGTRIRVILTDDHSIGLDTPEQVPHLEALLAACKSP